MKVVKENIKGELTWDEELEGKEIPEDPEIYSRNKVRHPMPKKQLPDKTDKIH